MLSAILRDQWEYIINQIPNAVCYPERSMGDFLFGTFGFPLQLQQQYLCKYFIFNINEPSGNQQCGALLQYG